MPESRDNSKDLTFHYQTNWRARDEVKAGNAAENMRITATGISDGYPITPKLSPKELERLKREYSDWFNG